MEEYFKNETPGLSKKEFLKIYEILESRGEETIVKKHSEIVESIQPQIDKTA